MKINNSSRPPLRLWIELVHHPERIETTAFVPQLNLQVTAGRASEAWVKAYAASLRELARRAEETTSCEREIRFSAMPS